MRRMVAGLGILWLSAPAWGQPAASPAAASTGRRPNIILIVADDLGYADLGCQGAKDIATPQVDSLAANGVRFTNGYVSCPVCSPTRAGLMTGRYQQRFGHEFNPGPATQADANFGLPLGQKTIADDLKAAGYTTGMVGKWHLGYKPEFHPMKRGFDAFFGFPGGAHSYTDPKAESGNPILRGLEPVDEKEYLTDAFGREAAAFIDQHAREPFFLYLPFNAVHTPNQVPERYLQRFASIENPLRRSLAAKLSAMDDAVGRVLEAVRKNHLDESTLIFFHSDNGGPTAGNGSRNNPLSGFKSQVLEGGIRVPFIMQWKGTLPAAQVYERPVISLDILPTAVAAAGGTVPADRGIDGVNLLPFLRREQSGSPHDKLFWRFGASHAMRRGDDKLVVQNGETPQLFNLVKDVAEKHDLAAEKPELLRELQSDYDAWNATLAKPLWQGRGGGKARNASSQPAGGATDAADAKPAKRKRAQAAGDRQPRQERRAERKRNQP